jgi:Sulfatase-modifying factor enzyme 1/Caspase domain
MLPSRCNSANRFAKARRCCAVYSDQSRRRSPGAARKPSNLHTVVAVAEVATPLAFELFALTGETPPELALPILPPLESGADALRRAFSALALERSPTEPCVIIYAAGHAWLDAEDEAAVALKLPSGLTQVLSGPELFGLFEQRPAGRRAIVVLDVCHAAAFEAALKESSWKPCVIVFASAGDQQASAFSIEGSTRLMSALTYRLSKSGSKVDLDQVLTRVSADLSAPDVIAPQSVEVFRFGSQPLLTRLDRVGALGTRVNCFGNTWRSHSCRRDACLDCDLLGVVLHQSCLDRSRFRRPAQSSARNPSARDTRGPARKCQLELSRSSVDGKVIRLRLPAKDIIVHIEASYPDNRVRKLNFPLLLSPGVSIEDKFRDIALPSSGEILAHPGMAYLPKGEWIDTPGAAPRTCLRSFWIDIYPLTVSEYEPLLQEFLRTGVVTPDHSVLAQLVSQSDLKHVGGQKVGELAGDLAPILNIVNAAAAERPVSNFPVVPRLAAKPCAHCPAPVSYAEAVAYCKARHARVPEFAELELAGRGVDGRRYPWGDRYDGTRANAPGLPEKQHEPTAITPVDAYATGARPFGLMDIVGNAGKWAAQDDDSYLSYFGASFRQSGEEVEPFARIPYVEGTSIPEISVRCAQNG